MKADFIDIGEVYKEDITQFYHPTGKYKQDSYGIVYNYGLLNKTKFFPILLKEWFFLVKKNGYLVVDYLPNKMLDKFSLEKNLWWLWKDAYEIRFHGEIGQNELRPRQKKLEGFIKKCEVSDSFIKSEALTRLVIEKTRSTKVKGDDIGSWTFGIITNGQRPDYLSEMIAAIKSQKIPKCEIVLCGPKSKLNMDADVKIIDFNQRSKRGWITKKKNLIVKSAKYENICILHDRVVLDKDWYKHIKKFGNAWEVLSCIQTHEGYRKYDWYTFENYFFLRSKITFALLEPKDWDKYMVQGGQLHIAKKSVFKEVMFDESYFWGDNEDTKLCLGFADRGYVMRLPQGARARQIVCKYKPMPIIKYSSQKLSSFLTGLPIYKIVLREIGQKIFYVYFNKKLVI